MGRGSKIVLCLHGFGESKSSFALLEKHLQDKYTFLCLDLPFHGDTEWNEGLLFCPEDLKNVIHLCFKEIGLEEDTTFSTLAYSLGGRLVLWLIEKEPRMINRAILLAPDGLHVNFWYWLGTQTWAGNKLFQATMKRPGWFFGMINMSSKLGMLNKSIIKLVHYYLGNEEGRLLLYERWTTLRKFKPDLKVVKKNVTSFKIPVRLVLGNYDQIILKKRGIFLQTNNDYIKVTVLGAGHQLLKEKYMENIIQQFSN